MPFDDNDRRPAANDADRGIADLGPVHRRVEGQRNDDPNPAICSEISLHALGERSLQHEKAVGKRQNAPRSRDGRRTQRRTSHSANNIVGTEFVEAAEALDAQHRRRIEPADGHRDLLRKRMIQQGLARARNSLHQFDCRPEAIFAEPFGQIRLYFSPARQGTRQGFPAYLSAGRPVRLGGHRTPAAHPIATAMLTIIGHLKRKSAIPTSVEGDGDHRSLSGPTCPRERR